MKQHNVIQGSPEWLALRAQYFTASEAPAMLGVSPYMTRTELLQQKHSGIVPDVPDFTQKLYDEGHATEARYRPIAESIVGDDLYAVTGSVEIDGLKLLASFDGLTMDEVVGFEHKLWSEENARAIEVDGEPPMHHVWQMEHQLLVSGATHILFATSNGTVDQHAYCWYSSKPERRAILIAGWKQFAADLAVYVPSVAEAKPTGHAPETLPALHIEVTGMVTASNLDDFKATALAAIRGVNRELKTDQHFADAEKAVKWCIDVEQRLEAAKQHALSQTASIDELFRTIDDISTEAKAVRLGLSKLIKDKKESIRSDIAHQAVNDLAAHVMQLNLRIGKPLMPAVPADFAGVMKGKRSIDSLNDAVSVELARAKIAANEVADRIQVNLRTVEAAGMPLLFADLPALVQKQPDDLAAVIENRIAKFNADEAAREAAKAAIAAAQAPAVTTAAPVVTSAAPVAVTSVSLMPPTDPGALIKLGDINARMAPVSITADGLAELGFVHVRQDKAAKLYRETDYPLIVRAIVSRLSESLQPQHA